MNTTVIPITSNRAVYTVAEVPHMLSLLRGNTYAMIRFGDIPSMRIGHRWLIPKARLVVSDWRFTDTGWITAADAVLTAEAASGARQYATAWRRRRNTEQGTTRRFEEA